MKHVFRFPTKSRRWPLAQAAWLKCRLRLWLDGMDRSNNHCTRQLRRPASVTAGQLRAPSQLNALFLLSLFASLLAVASSFWLAPTTTTGDVLAVKASGGVLLASSAGNDTQLRGEVAAANGARLLPPASKAFDNQQGDSGDDEELARQQVVVRPVTRRVNKTWPPAVSSLDNGQPEVSSVTRDVHNGKPSHTSTGGLPKIMLDYDGDESLTNDDDEKDSAPIETQIDAAAVDPTGGEAYADWTPIGATRNEAADEEAAELERGTPASSSNDVPEQSNGDELGRRKGGRLRTVADAAIRRRWLGGGAVRLETLGNRQVDAERGQPNETKVAAKIATTPPTTTTTSGPAAVQMPASSATLMPILLVNATKLRTESKRQQPDAAGQAAREGRQQESDFYYYYKNNGTPSQSERRYGFCVGHQELPKIFAWTCTGLHRTVKLPAELQPLPNTLRLSIVDIEKITADALQPYKDSLRDFSIENAPRLNTIERNAFANLARLRVVYIFQAPRLVSFDLAITGRHPVLAIIRIQQTGLKIWPDLSEFKQQKLLTSIDLDNNQIESLGSKPINIQAEVVNLEFNDITSIEEHTFNGSEIGALSLSGNRQLTSIHRNAFANLKNLIQLDLSGTGLTQLPTVGMHQLRMLKVQDNYALKQIPSIFVFPMLEEAHMTYSFHCCSFRYPKTHDPSAYEEHIRLQNEINAICSKRQQSVAVESKGPKATGDEAGKQVDWTRARRWLSSVAELGNAPLSPSVVMDTGQSAAGEHEPASTTPSSDFEGSFFDTVRQQHTTGGGGGHQAANAPHTTTVESARSAHDYETTSIPMHGNMSISVHNDNNKDQWLLQDIECGELVQKPTGYQNIVCTPTPDAFNPCEDIMGYPVLRVAVWFVVACSMFGNMSVIVVLLGIFRRLSVPKFLQLNLAIGDLFMGVYLAMLAGADIMTVGTYFNYALDWQHGLGCQLAGASSLFASQLSIFTLIVITFERYYTITYSIDLNMRLQLGWAARIMLIGWIYAFASAMLPIFANINSYSKTSICLPMRTIFKLDRVFILVLLVVDSCAFLIIFICYLRMYLLILKQKTEATLKERTVAMRMALLVLTDFACWAPIIFFSSTAVFGHPLISVTNSKILIVFFYPLNSMANPFLYVLSTRQYRRDLNYVIGRWHHWRKNLFKSRDDKDYSFNNSNPYSKYPIAMNAHLNAVAAVTGVASHLHGYRIPIGAGGGAANGAHHECETPLAPGQQVELVKFGGPHENGTTTNSRHCRHKHCSHRHKHHHNHHYHNNNMNNQPRQPRANGSVRQIAEERVACAIKLDGRKMSGRSSGAHYIIRHQILPEKCAPGSHHTVSMSRTTRMVSYTNEGMDTRSSRSPKREPNCGANGGPQRQQSYNTVKLGLVIDDNDRVSSLEDSTGQAANLSEASRLALVGSEFQESTFDATAGNEQDQLKTMQDFAGGQRHQQQVRLGEPDTGRHRHVSGHCRTKDGTKSDAGSQQCLAMTRMCMCGRERIGRGSGETGGGHRTSESRSKSANWTSRLNIRNRATGQKGDQRQHKLKLSSPSKSAQTTVTTDANTSTTTSTSTTTRSQTEPTDMETTATIETTTTTGNEDSQAFSEKDAGCNNDSGLQDEPKHHKHRKHHHRHHNRHQHHHHRHHHHHHHRNGRSRDSSQLGGGGSLASNGLTLERITESSNTDRSLTPKQHDRDGHRHRHRHDHGHHRKCSHKRKHSNEAHEERNELDLKQADSLNAAEQVASEENNRGKPRRDHHQHNSMMGNHESARASQQAGCVQVEIQSADEDQTANDKTR